ncbi:MAG: hypothetical protein H3Z54_09580 [archaeon]|nr:hypothetical protein [archaeon]
MTDEDIWASLGAILSTILAGLSWLWNIGFLQLLFSFLTGALTTYFVQSRLQDRIEKRRTAVENIKKIYAPFFLEIKNTKENLLLNLGTKGIGYWTTIINQPEIFCVETKFKDQMVEFCKRANSLIDKINKIERIVADILYDVVNKTYSTSFGWIRLLREPLEGFRIDLVSVGRRQFAPIVKCAILKNDPIEKLQKTAFLGDQLEFVVSYIYQEVDSEKRRNEHEVPISELRPPFNDFWKDILEKVHKDTDVSKFDSERHELIEIADSLLERLGKHIDKYVEIEKIRS